MMTVVSTSSTSTSGRASVGMKPWTKALYVSLISRCDSAAIVPTTSELFPEPETPVNTVSRRFGISTLTCLRLFTRAPCTRIRSWLSAPCGAADCVSVLMPQSDQLEHRMVMFHGGHARRGSAPVLPLRQLLHVW